MRISDLLAKAAADLSDSGIAEPSREARSILTHILNRDTAFIIAHPEYTLTSDELASFTEIVERRRRREPLQYIKGSQEFYGLEFMVESGVLIPRPETEILVEKTIEVISDLREPNLLELGVGSGCISISVLHSVGSANAVGVDISDIALRISGQNAARHGVADRLALKKSDLFEGVTNAFDVIVSNPPYIPARDRATLQPEVGLYEPEAALFSGDDGLDGIRRIVKNAPEFLRSEGFLLIEIGYGQSESVKELYDLTIWHDVEFIPDLQGIERVVKARLRAC